MKITVGIGTFAFEGTATEFALPLVQTLWKDWLGLTQQVDPASLLRLVTQGKENETALQANADKLTSVLPPKM